MWVQLKAFLTQTPLGYADRWLLKEEPLGIAWLVRQQASERLAHKARP